MDPARAAREPRDRFWGLQRNLRNVRGARPDASLWADDADADGMPGARHRKCLRSRPGGDEALSPPRPPDTRASGCEWAPAGGAGGTKSEIRVLAAPVSAGSAEPEGAR